MMEMLVCSWAAKEMSKSFCEVASMYVALCRIKLSNEKLLSEIITDLSLTSTVDSTVEVKINA